MKNLTPKNIFVWYALFVITAIAAGTAYRFWGLPIPASYHWLGAVWIVLSIVLALFSTISRRDRLKKMRREIWFGEKDDS